MGWFAVMGAESVDYHRGNVIGIEGDYASRALDYYGSRGETPLEWGDTAAARDLGLVGPVEDYQWDAMFGPGGARHPVTGLRLANTKRPGIELAIAAHKSVSLLGVIGRAEDMHAILDAETDATMAYLDKLSQERGGRRGVAAVITPTTGLIYAQTRHATSRAGDPALHDHVLIPNLCEMLDDRGGYKGLFTAQLRDWLDPATIAGRVAAAEVAVRLGYSIEWDHGDSGRLRHWRITGIPVEVCEAMSKRKDEIAEYLEEHGQQGYRAANIAARVTRQAKRGDGAEELMPRWRDELAALGWPVERLTAAVEAANRTSPGILPAFSDEQIEAIAAELLDPDGEFLARGKVFTRSRLLSEAGSLIYGQHAAELRRLIDGILRSPLVVPLLRVAGAREQPYTAAAVLVAEQTIAEVVERLVDRPGPDLDEDIVLAAIAGKQAEIDAELSEGQYAAINAICRSGRAVDVMVGIAGSGKTTALDAATTALEEAGYTVIGTATSGQAARTLGREAGIEARTMRSLLNRLDTGQITLGPKSIVILDEAGMTADADMARLLLAVEAARAKAVIVGDDRQLSAVGPGGALVAVLDRHPEIVTALTENLRQRDPAERDALLDLRSGDLDAAIGYYADNGRIVADPDRVALLDGIVKRHTADIAAGHDTVMMAWTRRNVADLNRLARHQARQTGAVTGPEVTASGGRSYAVGDLVVTLAPNYRGQLVTSERGRVVAVDPEATAVTVRTDAGRTVTLLGSEIGEDRLDYGYALTVHREQGATCDRTLYLADGGGRELAYVALSRGRDTNTIHTVADDLGAAVEKLADEWSRQQHDTWLTPTVEVGTDPRTQPAPPIDLAARRERLQNELAARLALEPPDITNELDATETQLAKLRDQRDHLVHGTGPYRRTPAGRIARQLADLDNDIARTDRQLAEARPWERPKLRRLVNTLGNHQAATLDEWEHHVVPEARRLDSAITRREDHASQLEADRRFNQHWRRDHPEHTRQVATIRQLLADLDRPDEPQLAALPATTDTPERDPDTQARIDRITARLDRLQQEPKAPREIGGRGL